MGSAASSSTNAWGLKPAPATDNTEGGGVLSVEKLHPVAFVMVASQDIADAAVAHLHLLRDHSATTEGAEKPLLVRRGGYLQCQIADAHGYRTTKSRHHNHPGNSNHGPRALTAADAGESAGDAALDSTTSNGDGSEVDGRLLLKRARERGSSNASRHSEVVALGSGRQILVGSPAGQQHDSSSSSSSAASSTGKRPGGRKIVTSNQSTDAEVSPDDQGSNDQENSKVPGGATKKIKGPPAATKAPKAPPMEAKDIKVLSFAELMEKKRQNKE